MTLSRPQLGHRVEALAEEFCLKAPLQMVHCNLLSEKGGEDS